MLASLLLLATSGVLVSGGCRDTLDPWDRLPQAPGAQLVMVADTLFPEADTYIRLPQPNSNWGTATALELGGGGKSRVLVRFDSTALRQVVGAGTLDSAWLEFTITAGPSGWGTNERTVDLHRLLKDWTELGATWNCAVDANTTNSVPDCPTQGWDMTNNGNGTYAPSKTDRLKVSNGQTGVIRLNVTADVQGYLAGSLLHQGWVFRKTAEAQGGEAVIFSRESGSQPRLVVWVSTAMTVPALPPDSFPAAVAAALFASSNMVKDQSGTDLFPQDLLRVAFRETATQQERQAAIDAIGGQVVGGRRLDLGGDYFVQIVGNGTFAPLQTAIATLHSFPQVDFAVIVGRVQPNYRRPVDGPGWTTWDLQHTAAQGQTWALEAINSPFAWGCDTGSRAIRVGILDHSFSQEADLIPNLDAATAPNYDFYSFDGNHGSEVASLVGAVGNNTLGITGVSWTTSLLLTDFWMTDQGIGIDFVGNLDHLARQGVPIINISRGRAWDHIPGSAQDSALVLNDYLPIRRTLAKLDSTGFHPLLVVSAGNDSVDTWWNGTSTVAQDYPDRVLVVGGVRLQAPGNLGAYSRSNFGSLVDIVAPAEGVFVLGAAGTPIAGTGTSFAAPLVSGIASLLLSFDPGLSASEVKTKIVEGAVKGGRSVAGKYVADAYAALMLVAERPGAPLCGNRVWTEGSLVKVQRGTVTDTLRDVGAQLFNVTTMHGGKRVLYTTLSGVGALQYQNGAWVLAAQLPSDTLFNGVTSSVSHDGDSVATVCCWGGGPLTVEIGAVGASPAYTHTVPLPGRSSNLLCEMELNGTCQQQFDAGLEYSPYPADDDPGYTYSIQYSTAGDEVYLSVPTWVQHIASQGPPTTCPFSQNPALLCYPISLGWQVTGATVYAINIRTGARRTVDGSTGTGIWQVGVSESNQQMASVRGAYQYSYVRRWWLGTSGGPFGSFSNCAWEFTPINGVTAPGAQSFPLPAGSVCTGTPSRGTFAPIRAAARRAGRVQGADLRR